MYKVYRHTSPSGNVYIGITMRNDVRRRWERGNGYKTNVAFWNAIQKYGWDNIKHEILFEGLTKERACNLEITLIRHYKNLGISYNISTGGDCGFNGIVQTPRTGWHHSPETCKKISEHNIGKKCPFKGQKRPKSVGEKVSRAKKGIATRGKGWHHSPETRSKISRAHIGIKPSSEARKRMSLAKKGKPGTSLGMKRTPETRQLQSELKKQYYATHKIKWLHKIIGNQIIRTRCDEARVEQMLSCGWIMGRNSIAIQ